MTSTNAVSRQEFWSAAGVGLAIISVLFGWHFWVVDKMTESHDKLESRLRVVEEKIAAATAEPTTPAR